MRNTNFGGLNDVIIQNILRNICNIIANINNIQEEHFIEDLDYIKLYLENAFNYKEIQEEKEIKMNSKILIEEYSKMEDTNNFRIFEDIEDFEEYKKHNNKLKDMFKMEILRVYELKEVEENETIKNN